MGVKDQIIEILNSSETARIRFSFTGNNGVQQISVEPRMFRSVAEAISRNQIRIVENHGQDDPAFLGDIAMYSSRANTETSVSANTLYLGRNPRYSRLFNALIVHESVHAAFDINSRSMPWIDNECAGYIAQAYYARNSGLPRTAYQYGSESILAYSVVEGIRGHNDSDVTFFLGELRSALRRNRMYSRYINSHFDGDGV
jgi:hypothetical protein